LRGAIIFRGGQTPAAGSVLPHQECLSATGLVSRGDVVSEARFANHLRHGRRNGSLGILDRDPEGGPESRLWAAVVGEHMGEQHACERRDKDGSAGP
jgi:hypothetical protein